jgi:predicted phage terminase large subunit-like protein
MEMLYPGYMQRPDVTLAKSESIFTFHNGSEILFEGLDPSRIDKVLGAQYATAWVNECNEISDYEGVILQLASRMADSKPIMNRGKKVMGEDGKPVMLRPLMLFDCNPNVKDDWEYKLFQLKQDPLSNQPLDDADNYASLLVPPHDNAANQALGYADALKRRYKHSPKMMARFVEGMWSDNNPSALFRRDMFKYRDAPESLLRIVVGVDPAGSSGNGSDYTGIVVVGLDREGNAYVLEDASIKGTPEQWAAETKRMFDEWEADLIVAERNYGGEMVEHTIRSAHRNLPVKTVTASRSKIVRAEPVSIEYHKGRVFHTMPFKELEEQMCDYTPATKKSPDRMDALVWALTELLKLNTSNLGTVTVKHGTGVWR